MLANPSDVLEMLIFRTYKTVEVEPRMRCYIVLTVLLALFTGQALAQVSLLPYDQAMAALEAGHHADAEQALYAVLDRDPNYAEAHYALAHLYLETPLRDLHRANRHLRWLLDRNRDDTRSLELTLTYWRLKQPEAKITSATDSRRLSTARHLLALDSTNAEALYDLGLYAYYLDRFDEARAYFERVLTYDPQHRNAYEKLFRTLIKAQDYDGAEHLALRMSEHLAGEPAAWLYLGLAQYRRQRPDQAEGSFERALALMPPQERAVYLDVGRFLPEGERVRYREDSLRYAGAYWQSRDPRLLTRQNERLLEHYARLVHADLFFGSPGVRGWDSPQGQFIVRYGLPEATRQFTQRELASRLVDQDSIGPRGIFSGSKVEMRAEDWYYFGEPWRFTDEWRTGEYVLHAETGEKGVSNPGWDVYYEAKARQQFRELPEHFDYEPPGARVEFPYLASVFKGADGAADLLIPYGVPLPFKPRRGDLDLALRTGAFLLSDSTGLLAETRRNYRTLASRQITTFAEATLWLGAHQLTARTPGSYQVSVEFETETAVVVGFHRSDVVVPDFRSDHLMLSDVLLAYGVEEAVPGEAAPPGYLRREGLLIQPAPWGVYATRQPLYFYFEMYNLDAEPDGQRRYEIEAVLVEKRDEGGLDRLIRQAFGRRGREGVSVSFEGTGTRTDEGQYLILDVAGQAPGTYMLAVRVTDQVGGETVETRRTVLLE